MKLIFFSFLFAIACSSRQPVSHLDQIGILQEIWNSKDAVLALKKIHGLHKVEEDELYESLSTDEKVYIFSLAIYVSKKEKK
jgi:hypothetical protein